MSASVRRRKDTEVLSRQLARQMERWELARTMYGEDSVELANADKALARAVKRSFWADMARRLGL